MLPKFLKPFFWSYDFSKLDARKHRERIFVNLINYGGLKEWQWLKSQYGEELCRQMLKKVRPTEFRIQAKQLAELVF